MQLRRLVFPAPLGPMIALRAPRATEKLTSETAVTPPKRRATREMSRRGGDIRPETTPLRYRAKPAPKHRGDVTRRSQFSRLMRMWRSEPTSPLPEPEELESPRAAARPPVRLALPAAAATPA